VHDPAVVDVCGGLPRPPSVSRRPQLTAPQYRSPPRHRPQAHLGGSDQAAYGGDVAFRYGITGTLAGVGWGAARDTVAAQDFGGKMQALQPTAEANAGPVKLG